MSLIIWSHTNRTAPELSSCINWAASIDSIKFIHRTNLRMSFRASFCVLIIWFSSYSLRERLHVILLALHTTIGAIAQSLPNDRRSDPNLKIQTEMFNTHCVCLAVFQIILIRILILIQLVSTARNHSESSSGQIGSTSMLKTDSLAVRTDRRTICEPLIRDRPKWFLSCIGPFVWPQSWFVYRLYAKCPPDASSVT